MKYCVDHDDYELPTYKNLEVVEQEKNEDFERWFMYSLLGKMSNSFDREVLRMAKFAILGAFEELSSGI